MDAKFSYVSKNLEYALAFDEKKPKGMKPKDEALLTRDEREWLLGCKIKINADYVSEHKDEFIEVLGEMGRLILERLSGEEDGRKD